MKLNFNLGLTFNDTISSAPCLLRARVHLLLFVFYIPVFVHLYLRNKDVKRNKSNGCYHNRRTVALMLELRVRTLLNRCLVARRIAFKFFTI